MLHAVKGSSIFTLEAAASQSSGLTKTLVTLLLSLPHLNKKKKVKQKKVAVTALEDNSGVNFNGAHQLDLLDLKVDASNGAVSRSGANTAEDSR